MAQLKPQSVFDCFAQINQVPRPSKREEKITAFLRKFGEDLGLETLVDEAGNVLIRKPGTPGFENRKTVILQSHQDMVCEKNKDVEFDFDNDAIQTYVDGDWLKAKGTTLGADDGIGIAMEMALLKANDIEHGPIECVFTRDEETGLTGAFEMKPGFMTGDYLINLDSEDEGQLFVSCAGGGTHRSDLHRRRREAARRLFDVQSRGERPYRRTLGRRYQQKACECQQAVGAFPLGTKRENRVCAFAIFKPEACTMPFRVRHCHSGRAHSLCCHFSERNFKHLSRKCATNFLQPSLN